MKNPFKRPTLYHRSTVASAGPRDLAFRADVVRLQTQLAALSQKSQLLDDKELEQAHSLVRNLSVEVLVKLRAAGVAQAVNDAKLKDYWDREYQRVNDVITFGKEPEE